MPLPTLREVCIALFAGTVTVPATVAVVKHKSPPARHRPAPAKPRPAAPVAIAPRLMPCEPVTLGPSQLAVPVADTQLPMSTFTQLLPLMTSVADTDDRVFFPPIESGPFILTLPPSPPPISAIPEPSSWVMMGAGVFLIGIARRRKK